MKAIRACIFDLDGVIVDTAHFHYLAWKKLAATLDIELTEDYNERLKGVSRMDSLDIILSLGNVELPESEKKQLATKKNDWYLEFIKQLGPKDALPGVVPFLEDLKAHDVLLAIGSSSKNAKPILASLQLTHYFDVIVDGNDLTRAKPDPEVFLKAAQRLGTSSDESIVFEDAFSGIEAAVAAGMFSVGIGSNEILNKADLVLESLEGFNVTDLQESFMTINHP